MPKICSQAGCGTPVFSKGLCQYHWRQMRAGQQSLTQTNKSPAKPFKITAPIKKVSSKQAKLNTAYNALATQFKKDRPICEVQLQNCTYTTEDIHHLYSGASRSKYFLDSREWLPTCRHCHYIIHNVLSKEDAIVLGLKKIE